MKFAMLVCWWTKKSYNEDIPLGELSALRKESYYVSLH